MALTYQNRMSQIVAALNGFLRQFKTPEHLTDQTAMERIRMTAEAMNRRFPSGLDQDALAERLTETFVTVLEKHRGRDWPNVEAFVTAMPKFNAVSVGVDSNARGKRSELSAEELSVLERQVLPKAREWLNKPELRDQGKQILEFWGEAVE